MRLQHWCWLGLCLWLAPALAQDNIYTWTDEQGRLHYGDKKPEGQTVDRLELTTTPSIRTVSDETLEQLLAGRWQYNLSQGRGRGLLHFRHKSSRVTGALPFDGEELQPFRGTWQRDEDWIVLEVHLLDVEQDAERAITFAITELTEYTMVHTHRDGSKTYWYFADSR